MKKTNNLKWLLTFIFALLLFAADAQKGISHYQLDEPEIGTSDSVLFFVKTGNYWSMVKGVMDTSKIVGLRDYIELIAPEQDLSSYSTKTQLGDSVILLRGEIPTLLTQLSNVGFTITESQISDLQDYLTNSDLSGLRDSTLSNTGKDTTGIYHVNRALLDAIDVSDTTRWGEQPDFLTDLDSTNFDIDTTQVRNLKTFVENNSGGSDLWTVSGDTISPKSYPVRIDTMIMGDEEEYLPINMYSVGIGEGIYFNGTSTTTFNTVKKIVLSESGRYIYKINNSDNKLMFSNDFGDTFSEITTLTGAPTNMKCSNNGASFIISFDNSNSYLLSKNYGNTLISGNLTSNITDVNVTEDGSLFVLLENYDGFYYYNDILSSKVNLTGGIYNVAIDSDSTVYYTIYGTQNITKIGKMDSGGNISYINTTIYTYTYAYGDPIKLIGNRVYYVDDRNLKYTDDFVTSTIITTIEANSSFTDFDVSGDYSYIYYSIYNYSTTDSWWRYSKNSGYSFEQIYYKDGMEMWDISINSGIYTGNVSYHYEEGMIVFDDGGIRLSSTYTPIYPKDVITKDYLDASGIGSSGGGDITSVNTSLTSGMDGGVSSGEANLSIAPDRLNESYGLTNNDVFIIGKATSGYTPLKITAQNMTTYFSGGGGYVLPMMSETTLGGGKIHDSQGGLIISGTGVLGVNSSKNLTAVPSSSDIISFWDVSTNSEKKNTIANILRLDDSNIDYPSGSGIPVVVDGFAWGTTISPSTGFLYYNGSSYSWQPNTGGDMVYPSSTGLAYYNSSTGTWGTSITDNSSNWNTAYSWGDHSTEGYLTDAPSNGSLYGRKDGAWTVISTGTSAVTSVVAGNLVDVSSTTGDVTVNVDLSDATSDNTFSSTDELIYLTGSTQKRGTVSGLESYMQSNLSFGGETNLSTSYSSTNVTVNSDTGDDATINAATTSNAGVMSAADKVKVNYLDGTGDGTLFLSDDGTYSTPPSSGGVGTSSNTELLYNNSGSVGGASYIRNISGQLVLGDEDEFIYPSSNEIGLVLGNKRWLDSQNNTANGFIMSENYYGSGTTIMGSTQTRLELGAHVVLMGKVYLNIYDITTNERQNVEYDVFVYSGNGGSNVTGEVTLVSRTGTTNWNALIACSYNSPTNDIIISYHNYYNSASDTIVMGVNLVLSIMKTNE